MQNLGLDHYDIFFLTERIALVIKKNFCKRGAEFFLIFQLFTNLTLKKISISL
jgi:hypothetical protein